MGLGRVSTISCYFKFVGFQGSRVEEEQLGENG